MRSALRRVRAHRLTVVLLERLDPREIDRDRVAALVSSGTMPLPKRPYVASADQILISRKGDTAIIEYADESVATTHVRVGSPARS